MLQIRQKKVRPLLDKFILKIGRQSSTFRWIVLLTLNHVTCNMVFTMVSVALAAILIQGATATTDEESWCQKKAVQPYSNQAMDCLPEFDISTVKNYGQLNPGRLYMGIGHLELRLYPYFSNVSLGAALHSRKAEDVVEFLRPTCFYDSHALDDPGTGVYVHIRGCKDAIKRFVATAHGFER